MTCLDLYIESKFWENKKLEEINKNTEIENILNQNQELEDALENAKKRIEHVELSRLKHYKEAKQYKEVT